MTTRFDGRCPNGMHAMASRITNYYEGQTEPTPSASDFKPGRGEIARQRSGELGWVWDFAGFRKREAPYARRLRRIRTGPNRNRDTSLSMPRCLSPSVCRIPTAERHAQSAQLKRLPLTSRHRLGITSHLQASQRPGPVTIAEVETFCNSIMCRACGDDDSVDAYATIRRPNEWVLIQGGWNIRLVCGRAEDLRNACRHRRAGRIGSTCTQASTLSSQTATTPTVNRLTERLVERGRSGLTWHHDVESWRR